MQFFWQNLKIKRRFSCDTLPHFSCCKSKGLSGFAKCVIGHLKLIVITKIRMTIKSKWRLRRGGVWVRAPFPRPVHWWWTGGGVRERNGTIWRRYSTQSRILLWSNRIQRSTVYLKRIRKRNDDRCWYCHKNGQKMTLLHCTNARLVSARQET
jgi:hypothetical protein